MTKHRMSDLIDAYNTLRIAAGLAPQKIAGTSKQAMIVKIDNAKRGIFN